MYQGRIRKMNMFELYIYDVFCFIFGIVSRYRPGPPESQNPEDKSCPNLFFKALTFLNFWTILFKLPSFGLLPWHRLGIKLMPSLQLNFELPQRLSLRLVKAGEGR
jgi:hypothetical protein